MEHNVAHLLSPEELAEYLQVPVSTIYTWRSRGTGPVAMKIGRHLRYAEADVEAWLERQREEAVSA